MPGIDKRTFSIQPEQTKYIDNMVKSGGYASASEVVRAGLRALQERDEAIERWLNNEVAPTYDAVTSGKMKTFNVSDAFDNIRARHTQKNAS